MTASLDFHLLSKADEYEPARVELLETAELESHGTPWEMTMSHQSDRLYLYSEEQVDLSKCRAEMGTAS